MDESFVQLSERMGVSVLGINFTIHQQELHVSPQVEIVMGGSFGVIVMRKVNGSNYENLVDSILPFTN